MIGTSTFDLYLIRACIFFLYYIAPLCILFCVANVTFYGFKAVFSPVPLVIESIAVAEILFYLLVYRPHRIHLQREALHPTALSRLERKRLFLQCNANIPDGEAYLEKWFLGAPASEIKRENLKDFFLWAFFSRDGPPGDDDEELEEYITLTEELLGREIKPGRGNAECLRLTLDKVDMMHRTLVWYLIVGLVDLFTYISLLYHGFHFHRLPLARFFNLFPFRPQTLFTSKKSPVTHLSYWHRQHTSKTKLPILFVHGIGIGLFPYVDFLADLNSAEGIESGDVDDQVGIIAIEILPISFRITHPAMSKSNMCAEIAKILAYHGWDKVVLVSHSFGTVVATHLLKTPSTAHLVGPMVLIDPVSILLHLPDVAYNFTRRKPQRANEHQLYYFASMDMSVSHTLARHFFWSDNILWKEDLEGRNVTVSLSGKDLIVDTESVGRYMASEDASWKSSTASSSFLMEVGDVHDAEQANGSGVILQMSNRNSTDDEEGSLESDDWKERVWKGKGVDVLWFKNQDHAQVFDSPTTRRPLLTAIKAYCTDGFEADGHYTDSPYTR